jgi:hypothetical protein
MDDPINLLSIIVSILALIVALITLYFMWRIPHQIMINQQYAELLTQYRSTEMGDAIFSILDFFVNDCVNEKGKPDVNLIEERYIARYGNEIKNKLALYKEKAAIYKLRDEDKYHCDSYDPHNTLHFKRRLVDHLFWLMAGLRFSPDYPVNLPAKQLRRDFSQNEQLLLYILYHMNKASEECQINTKAIDTRSPPPLATDNSPMAEYRRKLYEEAKHWKC